MNTVFGGGLLMPQNAKPWDIFFETLYSGIGEEAIFSRIAILRYIWRQKMLLTACQRASQKNQSSLVGALSKVHLKIPTFTIQNITLVPSNVAQMDLLKDKICVCLPYALPWHLSQCLAHQRCSKVIKRNQTNMPFHFIPWEEKAEIHPFPSRFRCK